MVHFTKVQKEEIMAKNSTQFWKTNNWSRLSWHRKVINWLSTGYQAGVVKRFEKAIDILGSF